MRSRILSNGWKWIAGQRARCLVNSSPGFLNRVRICDLQGAFTAERERSLYNESRIINFIFFSRAFSSETLDDNSASDVDEPQAGPARQLGKLDSNKYFLRRLRFRPDVLTALQEWTDKGKALTLAEIKNVVRILRRDKKYRRAVQVSEWMQKHNEFEPETGYYSVHMYLITKVHGIAHTEKYFEDLPENVKNQKTHGALLYCYVQEQLIEKAEQQMEKMEELGFASDEHSHSQMMALYMAIGQTDKVLLQVNRMKEMNVPLDTQTYNLWISACGAMSDIDGIEKIVDEIKARGGFNVHWTTYSTLANIYVNAGLLDKAEPTVKELERRIPQRDVVGFDSLITLYGALGNKEEVYRIWKSVKMGFDRPFFSSYKSVLASLVKVGDIEGAEKIFQEWETLSPVINCKLSNILLDVYIKKGMLEKAELFHDKISENKGFLNGRTWEILTEGYLESKQMSKAVVSLKKALAIGKPKDWQPKSENVMGILKHFEEQGNVKDAEEFLGLLRCFKCLTTEVYNSLLSTYIKAGEAASKVLEKMTEDRVSPDEETDRLLKLVNEQGFALKLA